jgi:hypothetical protein
LRGEIEDMPIRWSLGGIISAIILDEDMLEVAKKAIKTYLENR